MCIVQHKSTDNINSHTDNCNNHCLRITNLLNR